MSGATNLSGRALIVGSGAANPGAEDLIRQILAPFQHRVIDVQRIDLGGRTIIGVEIALDLAHAGAISRDLSAIGVGSGLDIAMEIL